VANRAPFDDALCCVVEEVRPELVSFHFGLPEAALLARVRAAGATIVSSATTVAEARGLAERGCDAIIAQGADAGGHRATFLAEPIAAVAHQPGTLSLVPQVVDAVDVPVIATGGIADARGIAAAFALGAAAVQIGTAFLFCPEAKVPAPQRAALRAAHGGIGEPGSLEPSPIRFPRSAGLMDGHRPWGLPLLPPLSLSMHGGHRGGAHARCSGN